jgi:hypothetical protein
MATGWIDVHRHFSPPQTPEQLKTQWHTLREGAFLIPSPFEWTLESTLSYLDKAGIAMQMLSNIHPSLPALRTSNDYGASLVAQRPSPFDLLAASLEEIDHAQTLLRADGFAVACVYNIVSFSDPSLDPV